MAFDDGGGIFNSATADLSLVGSRITFNSVSGSTQADGGGLSNEGLASVSGTMIDGNTAGRYGGGVRSAGTLSTSDGTTVLHNTTAGTGGGVWR